MCLLVDNLKNDGKAVVLTEDMTVFKILMPGANLSLVYMFVYDKHMTYKHSKELKIDRNVDSYPLVDEGFHAYTKAWLEGNLSVPFDTPFSMEYTEDSHNIAIFTIPKGAKVIYGHAGEIVTDTIRSGNLIRFSRREILKMYENGDLT